MKFPRLIAPLIVATTVVAAPQTAAANAIKNGGFENTYDAPNRWAGVDKDGFLAGFSGSMPAFGDNGGIVKTPLPVSPAVTDLTGDGLPDILASDALGYVRAYINSGSKEDPKFTSGALITPYLAFTDGAPAFTLPGADGEESSQQRLRIERDEDWSKRRLGVRLSVAKAADGRLSLVAGNYFGDLFLIPQSAVDNQNRFPQPEALESAMLPMAKGPGSRWGNLFTPLLHDWDGDGNADLLVGEGSYSANNIHFFPNKASSAAPSFDLASGSVLAQGEGRSQLTPGIADVNGDGKDDLLVSDTGTAVTAYLRPQNWKKGDAIKPSGFLASAGGLTSDVSQALVLNRESAGINAIATGDLNGDGLFDLVVGKPNGRLAWSANKGTKEQPKFETPADLPGQKPAPEIFKWPSEWGVDAGETRGNFFGYASSVSAQEDPAVDAKEGSRALKFAYAPSGGSPLANKSFPGNRSWRFGEYDQKPFFYDLDAPKRLIGSPSRVMMIQQNVELEVGKPYTLSFQHKGSGVARANVFLGWWGFKVLGQETVSRGARGAAQVNYNHANEHGKVSKELKTSGSWAPFAENFTVRFKENALKDEKKTYKAVLIITVELTAPDGVLYLDDLKIAATPA